MTSDEIEMAERNAWVSFFCARTNSPFVPTMTEAARMADQALLLYRARWRKGSETDVKIPEIPTEIQEFLEATK